jgi:hypothetical protein
MKIGTSMGQASIGEETKAAAEVVTEVRRKAETRRVSGERQPVFRQRGPDPAAVNIASRMESHGVAGRVQVTQATRRRLSEVFQLEERGIIDLKGTGPMNTWFLTGRTDVGDVG